ncbi:hypothetical protein GSI_11386 [Ganoderma sinense ZZ0214-1]|uniref:Uncharacterized protein n=1 Tax=Ganoderma sinense ZZ0214-1 TaxID=1077348 RepID=A0A2G8RVW0_9APHY|nr:hypothetical protein GSI_11386 [Ganoderma sinense ZZ0214-1]
MISMPAIPTGTARPIRVNNQLGTRRKSYLEWIHDRYPTFEPKNDYEIISIVENHYSGPESELRSALDGQFLLDIKFYMGLESLEAVARMHPAETDRAVQSFIRHAQEILDAPEALARAKPGPDTPNVFCRAIPNSPYAIRLFPGLLAQNEWFMDFIDAWTGETVNAPPGFQIYSARDSGPLPWLGGHVTIVRPIEGFRVGEGVSEAGVGTETFVLRDGQTCLLKRRGHKDVLFRVPMRAMGLHSVRAQVDQLDFPELV